MTSWTRWRLSRRWSAWGLPVVFGLLPLLGAGCWDSREIDELAFIMAIGIDKDESDGTLTVSYRIANPPALAGGESGGPQSGGNQSIETTFTVMVKAKTIGEAMSRFRAQVPRRPFLSHLQGIVIGESLARSGVREILDYFEREEELRRSIRILVTKDVSAAELFSRSRQRLITASGIAFSGLLAQAPEAAFAPVIRVGNFLERMASPHGEAFASALELSAVETTGQSPQDLVILKGTAVFQGDRLAGFLDEKETALLLLLRGGLRWTTVSLDEDEIRADIRLYRTGGSLDVVDPRALRFRATVQLGGALKQLRSQPITESARLIERMSEQLQIHLEQKTLELIQKLQDWGTDVVGFGEALYRRHPRVWVENHMAENWPYLFTRAQIEARVEGVISDIGGIIRSVSVPRRNSNEEEKGTGKR